MIESTNTNKFSSNHNFPFPISQSNQNEFPPFPIFTHVRLQKTSISRTNPPNRILQNNHPLTHLHNHLHLPPQMFIKSYYLSPFPTDTLRCFFNLPPHQIQIWQNSKDIPETRPQLYFHSHRWDSDISLYAFDLSSQTSFKVFSSSDVEYFTDRNLENFSVWQDHRNDGCGVLYHTWGDCDSFYTFDEGECDVYRFDAVCFGWGLIYLGWVDIWDGEAESVSECVWVSWNISFFYCVG